MSSRGSAGAWREKGREERAAKAVGLMELAPWPGVLPRGCAVADARARQRRGSPAGLGLVPRVRLQLLQPLVPPKAWLEPEEVGCISAAVPL